MFRRYTILLTLAVILVSCSTPEESKSPVLQQAGPAVVSLTIKPAESFQFNRFEQYSHAIGFKNSTDKDTLLTRKITLDKPSFWQYGNILMSPTGPDLHIYSMLLLPGDTLELKSVTDGALTIVHSSGYPKWIDSLITVPKDFYWHNVEQSQQKLLESLGIKGSLQNIENTFRKNKLRINRLNMSPLRIAWLKKLNDNIKYTGIAHLLADPGIHLSVTTDSLYKDTYVHMPDILSLDAVNNNTIVASLVAYNANKQNANLDKNDIWACAAGVDKKLKESSFYKDYLKSVVLATYRTTPKEIGNLKQQLAGVRKQSPLLDTLYQLTTILAETVVDYHVAKHKLKNFDGGRYHYMMEEDAAEANHLPKPTKDLPAVALYDFAGKKTDFKQVVVDDRYQLTLVDFWASWCLPCIREMPALKKAEEQLKGKPVQFVTISIDKDEDIDKWIAAAKENKMFNTPSQYRLADFKQSALTRLIHLKNIPRYLLIDGRGNIIDDNFYRPGDERFQIELAKHLN